MDLSRLSEMEMCLLLEHRLNRAARMVGGLSQKIWDDGRPSYQKEKEEIHRALSGAREAYKALTGETI